MSRRSVRWTKRALRRLDDVGRYIAKENPSAARTVTLRIVAVGELLADQPAMGRPGRIAGTRELVMADLPYILPYRVTPSFVEILSVIHTAQEWPDSF